MCGDHSKGASGPCGKGGGWGWAVANQGEAKPGVSEDVGSSDPARITMDKG